MVPLTLSIWKKSLTGLEKTRNLPHQSNMIRTLPSEPSLHSVQIPIEPFLFPCQNSFGNFLSSFISFHQKHNQHLHGCILAFFLSSFPSIRSLLFQPPWIYPSTHAYLCQYMFSTFPFLSSDDSFGEFPYKNIKKSRLNE